MNIIRFSFAIIALGLIASPLVFTDASAQPEGSPVPLTAAEKRHLAQIKEITYCVDPDWMPFEALRDGRLEGMTADYIDLFATRLGVPFRLVSTRSWAQSKAWAKAGICDILPMIPQTQKPLEYLAFTDPYLSYSVGIIAINELPFISDLADLSNHTVGIVEGYSTWEYVERNFPNNTFVAVEGVEDGLLKVSSGEISAFLIAVPVAVHSIKELGLSNLKVAGHIEVKKELRIGVSRQAPELLPIFEKLTASLTDKDIDGVYRKWISLRVEPLFDYDLLWKAGAALLLLLAGIALWNRKLSQLNREITKRVEKRTAELNKSMERYQAFASDVAHELRTPLAVIKTRLDSVGDEAVRANLRTEVDSMTRLIAKIMDLARVDTLSLEREKVELGAVCREVAEAFAPVAITENRSIALQGAEKPIFALIDPNAVALALRNLLENALRFAPEGSTVIIDVDDTPSISVIDHGSGVKNDMKKAIFQRFKRADQRGRGFGVGLSIVARVMEAHGGHIEIKDTPGGGSTFTMKFPGPANR